MSEIYKVLRSTIHMKEYTPEDGLNVLKHLRITNLTAEEKKYFKERWDRFYRGHNKKLIETTWFYMQKSCFLCAETAWSFVFSRLRDSDF